MDHPAGFAHLYPQAAQAPQMQVNGAQADLASPGICNRSLAEPGQNRPQQENGGANLFGQPVGHFPAMQSTAAHRHALALLLHLAAQNGQYLRHVRRIADARHIQQGHRILRQDGRRQYGQHRILGGIHPQRTFQPLTAFHQESLHRTHLPINCFSLCRSGRWVRKFRSPCGLRYGRCSSGSPPPPW